MNLVTADPALLDDALRYLLDEARPRVEAEPGHRGLSVVVNSEVGVAVSSSFWVSGDAMRASEKALAPIREQILLRGVGTVSVERHEVASAVHMRRPEPGAGMRLTRAEVDPRRVDDALTAYEDTALPWLVEADGFCSAMLFVNRRSGRTIEETTWRDAVALAASRSRAAVARVDGVAATDAAIVALEEYRLLMTTARSD